MKKYVCDVCGWEYDEALGDPDNGIVPGTRFEDLPPDFVCPLCGVGKESFSENRIGKRKAASERSWPPLLCSVGAAALGGPPK